MTKGEEGSDVFFVIIAIAYENALAITDLSVFARVIGVSRVILEPNWESSWQFAGRVHISEQNICKSIALFLARIPELDGSRDFIDPWHFNRGTCVQDDNCVWVGFHYTFDKFVLLTRQFHIDSVSAFGLPFRVQACDQDNDIGFLRQFHCFADQILSMRRL